MKSLMYSRSRSAYGNGVTAPTSIAVVPSETPKWLAMRLSSHEMTRSSWARLGTSICMSFSHAIAHDSLANIAAR